MFLSLFCFFQFDRTVLFYSGWSVQSCIALAFFRESTVIVRLWFSLLIVFFF